MMVIMKSGHSQEEMDQILSRLEEVGLKGHQIVGVERTVIAVVGSIYPMLFTMPGVGTSVPKARKLGSQIAEELVENDVDGALLVAT